MPIAELASAGSISDRIEAKVAATGRRPDMLLGLLGRGIQLSRTPAMHESEAARQGLSCAYLLIDFDQAGFADADLPQVIEAARAAGFRGLNVTHPFKQSILSQLSSLSAEAAAIGAVNTVTLAGEPSGHNTDCWGFAESFRRTMAGASLDLVVQFGAGGGGAAVAYALAGLGARRIVLVDNVTGRAEKLAAQLREVTGVAISAGEPDDARSADGIVNTTPVGMAKYPGMPFAKSLLRPSQWVADIIYFPERTQLLEVAAATGCRTLSGSGMAIGQAARAFELFTGRPADMAQMARHFEAAA